ncbi:MAG: hypothetical protein K2Y32_18520 [Candidatus Obscuribacterales bacterium]|nr:hypothetical protein [Candidatus Obscuribacterales bacterium]
MKETATSPALKALLTGFIDYAGLFPPAKLELDKALSNFEQYRQGQYAWMLRWFVLGAAELEHTPAKFDGCLSVIATDDKARAATIESTAILSASRPVYCEVTDLGKLETVKAAGNYAKIRTGGLKPEAIPEPRMVADFIKACAKLRLPFKATAGLHHPIRSIQPLTYEAAAQKATMHGFINVLMASCLAWRGEENIEPIIAETEANAFHFDDRAHWRNLSLSQDEIAAARKDFIHSVGSCSFEEPVQDLKALGWL